MKDTRSAKRRSRANSAFIICETGSDIRPLVTVLNGLNVHTLNVIGDVAPESSLSSTQELIEHADFVLAILNKDARINVALELGYALGARRPVAAIGNLEMLPVELSDIFRIGAPLSDPAALSFQLKLYLANLKRVVPRRRSEPRRSARSEQEKLVRPGNPISNVERDLLEAFQRSPEVDSVASHPRLEGSRKLIPDFAIWTTAVPDVLANPVIVEIKASTLVDVERAVDQVREYALASNAPTALLVFADWEGNARRVISLSPLILMIGLTDLKDLLGRGVFVDMVRQERNRYAHSAP